MSSSFGIEGFYQKHRCNIIKLRNIHESVVVVTAEDTPAALTCRQPARGFSRGKCLFSDYLHYDIEHSITIRQRRYRYCNIAGELDFINMQICRNMWTSHAITLISISVLE